MYLYQSKKQEISECPTNLLLRDKTFPKGTLEPIVRSFRGKLYETRYTRGMSKGESKAAQSL